MAEANFRAPAIPPPTVEELSDIAKALGITCGKELSEFRDVIAGSLINYQVVNDLVAPTLPVKYPRTPGYRPEPEDNKLNAWYWRCDIQGAAEGLLKGKTVAIKDNVCVAGVPMMNGTKIMQGFVPDIDATIVTRILDAGGRIVGKTNCESLCVDGVSWSNDTGPTLNMYDSERTTGGSSSGSAVAIQTGEADMAIGADQAGSIRIPASWCGIVGLKPTFGLVPYTGIVCIETTIDHVGPMANTVTDVAVLLEAITGYDGGRDQRQPRDLKIIKYSQALDVDVTGKRVAVLKEGFEGCDEDVVTLVKGAADKLRAAGMTVEEVSIPIHNQAVSVWAVICTDGIYNCMVRGLGGGHQNKGYYPESMMTKLREGYAANGRNWSENLKMFAMTGMFIDKNFGNLYYGRAQNVNMKLTQSYDKVLEDYDVLLMPTLPYKAPLLAKKGSSLTERLKNSVAMIKNTAAFDATGHPALTVNVGMSEGLPVGMQLVGKPFDETGVLQIAHAFEKIRDN